MWRYAYDCRVTAVRIIVLIFVVEVIFTVKCLCHCSQLFKIRFMRSAFATSCCPSLPPCRTKSVRQRLLRSLKPQTVKSINSYKNFFDSCNIPSIIPPEFHVRSLSSITTTTPSNICLIPKLNDTSKVDRVFSHACKMRLLKALQPTSHWKNFCVELNYVSA